MLTRVNVRNLCRVLVGSTSVLVLSGIGGYNLDPSDPGDAPVTWINHLPYAVTFTSCGDEACTDQDDLVLQRIPPGGKAMALLSEGLPVPWVVHRVRDGEDRR